MSVLMKKPHTETVSIGNQSFQVPSDKAKAVLVLVRGLAEDTIPADEVFKDLDAKYTRPGVALRGARGKEGISQIDLAEKLGVSQSDLSKMEHGKRPIGKKMAKRLAKILKIDYRVFL